MSLTRKLGRLIKIGGRELRRDHKVVLVQARRLRYQLFHEEAEIDFERYNEEKFDIKNFSMAFIKTLSSKFNRLFDYFEGLKNFGKENFFFLKLIFL